MGAKGKKDDEIFSFNTFFLCCDILGKNMWLEEKKDKIISFNTFATLKYFRKKVCVPLHADLMFITLWSGFMQYTHLQAMILSL